MSTSYNTVTFDHETGEVRVHGVDLGGKAKVHQIVANGRVIVKVPGGQHWAGRGQQAYHGAQFQVWQIGEIIAVDEHRTTAYVERQFDFPITAKPIDVRASLARVAANRESTHA